MSFEETLIRIVGVITILALVLPPFINYALTQYDKFMARWGSVPNEAPVPKTKAAGAGR